ncbi:MAG: ISKra4 family transposase, partial [Synechocystis sp.]
IGARLKLSGAQWSPKNVNRMLRLRCAYLNHAFSTSIYT